jgi:hypothetical protein
MNTSMHILSDFRMKSSAGGVEVTARVQLIKRIVEKILRFVCKNRIFSELRTPLKIQWPSEDHFRYEICTVTPSQHSTSHGIPRANY